MLSHPTTTLSDDRGAAAIFIAASMILLCGFVALAVDIGAGTDERRQDQIGADSSTLGGSLELVIYSGAGNPMQTAVNKIDALVDTNLGRDVPESAWNACTDPGQLFYGVKSTAMFGVTTNESDCISLSEDRNTLRVRVPPQEVDTSFGRVIGASSIPVSAFAESERNTNNGGASGAYPSGVLSTTPPGTELCVKTGTGGSPSQTCPGPTTGDFRHFRPYFYEGVDGDLSVICHNTEAFEAIARAIADGIDHWFSFSPVAPTDPSFTAYVNGGWCPAIPGPPLPNQVDSAAGFQASDITLGLVKGSTWPSTSYLGRLQRGPYVWTDTRMARLFKDKNNDLVWYEIDNQPLWTFIDDFKPMSATCQTARDETIHPGHPADTAAVYAAIDALKLCLEDTDPLNTEIFRPDIADSPRLAGAPMFWETTPLPSNSCCYTIKDFVPIWIEGLWVEEGPGFKCEGTVELITIGSKQVCIHHPGMTGDIDIVPPGQEKVDSASALLLRCDHLPIDVCASIQNAAGPRVLEYDLQLTR